ncbi:hypothetical protein HanRHA438_Chr00c03g0844461 [Helianthus annuus]|uniref:Transposase (putative) gypsy type domain-containing protein n=1 Tax=Helianthus annuus TaxID=4232 RepID=A0A9K3JEG5_HELAN|nr:hypothetical protein HanXRQr2_Chr03g0106611 [Helianthus annuus]KAJ0592769.1 hypothetical protein HanHA300_Chr03g0089021 [Helianthus annuus]KAJ0600412.1 hypothetical protein HanIR_Chr03g0116331 [Helianthus annuus]KAJ0607758.1 hypothetical protein HanHA89_Chr03g0100511 [Helianthus annuus]KAJ0767822.1 hypothetical protein HanLR1_Chr03g0093881 [Helianthus annuus]
MSRTGRSMIRSVLTAKDLESFVEIYKIPKRFSPTLPGPDDSAEYTPDRIVLYTLSFSSCGVRYPLSPFKVDLLRHFKVHFSQLHPPGFMRVVHFELSCVAVFGELSIPMFFMFYKLVSDGDWFTFAKRKDSISQPCYSFMPISTYPKEWKSRFIFVSVAMIPESPPLRDAKATNEDSGDCKDVQFVVDDKVEPSLNQGAGKKVTEGSVQVGDSAAEERDEEASSGKKNGPPDSLQVRSSRDDDNDEDLESRLVRKRKAAPPSSPKQVPVPRDIQLRLRSASGQKAFPATRAASELPPTGGSSHAPIEIPTAPSSSRVRDKTPEENERLRGDLQTSQTVAADLWCRVVDVERKLQEEKGAGAMLEQKERAWAREMAVLVEEKEELAAELKHQKELDSVSQEQLDTMYAEWGVTSNDNQKLAKEKYWLITEGFGSFLTAVSQLEEFKSSLEQIYRAYRDVGYQAGLKDGFAYSAQGLGRKETPLYNSKAKKRLSKLDKEFGI